MIIRKPIGRIDQEEYRGWRTVWLTMPFDHAHKRIQRLRAQDGREFGLKLEEEARLRGLGQGDVVFRDPETQTQYAIQVLEQDCLVIQPEKKEDLAPLAYVIGNRHAKLYWGQGEEEFLVPYEKTLEDMLRPVAGLKLTREARLLLADRSLMEILPASQRDHDHDHEHE